jgi:ligand-binding sensor domain-containing protein/signal transduction histidine kinase
MANRIVLLVTLSATMVVAASTEFQSDVRPEVQPIRLPVTDGADLRFVRVSVGEEPSHGRVGQIVQDDHGFMWFGTHNGLQRYDGYRFREYRHDPGNPNTLSGSYIYGLFKDRDGKIWVGSDKDLDRYDPATEIFTHYRPDPRSFEGWVAHISQDRDGILWLATNHGLNRLNPFTLRTTRYQHSPNDPASISSDLVRASLETRDGTFWVATTESLDLFDRRTGKVTRHFRLPERTAANRPHSEVSLCEDHTGTLWVAFSFDEGLARVDRSANKLVYYSLGLPKSDSEPLPGLRSIHEDEDGTLWLGTAGHGILKFNRDRGGFVRYLNDPSDTFSLGSNQVVSLFEDREGNIWAGTTGDGVNRFSRNSIPFRRYRHDPGNPNTLKSDYTSSVYLDSRRILWVGGTDTLTAIDRKTGQYRFLKSAKSPGSLSSTWVISMVEDHSGYLWLGTIDGGLNRYDYRTGGFQSYRHNSADFHSLSDDTVLGLFIDHAGTLWAGTEDGLSRFDAATQRFNVFKPRGNQRIRCRAITEDHRGVLWLGTLETGLLRFEPQSGQFTEYQNIPHNARSLSANQVNCVYVDRAETLWAGTENGLDRFDPASSTFTTYYERDGLPSSTLNSILEDSSGNLWISTSNGVSRFNPHTKTFKNYYAADGLLSNEFYNYASACKSTNGEMFFNSYAGVVSFFPEKIADNPYVPPVVLTDFLLFGKSVPIGEKSLLNNSILVTKSVTLTHWQNIFSLEFSALSYADPERNRYRYKLEGLDTEWNETDSTRRSATYTTLAPGDYIFRVQGHTNRGAWSGNGASLRIRILPPWWGTWWFSAGSTILVTLLLWSAYHVRVRGIQRRNRALERAEQEILALSQRLIHAQDEERTHIARELHDNLCQEIVVLSLSVSKLKQHLADRGAEAREQIERLQSRLNHLTEKVRHLSHTLHPAVLEFGGIASALRSLCAEFGSLSGVRIFFDASDLCNDLPPAAALCIYRVAQEALQNVAKHASVSRADVQLARCNGLVSLTVSDRGAGSSPRRGEPFGLGLVSMKERVRLVNGTFEFISELNRGTTVRIGVPIVPKS